MKWLRRIVVAVLMVAVLGYIGAGVYMYLFQRSFQYAPEGKFIELDADDPNSPFGDLGGIGQGDPLASFDAFDAGLEEVRYLGPEDVDGEQMDHYVLTVDAKAAAKASGTPMGSLPKSLTYDLWLDGEDLMRRMQSDVGGGGLTMTMSDWGEPVTVEAPPRSAIMPMPGMPAA